MGQGVFGRSQHYGASNQKILKWGEGIVYRVLSAYPKYTRQEGYIKYIFPAKVKDIA